MFDLKNADGILTPRPRLEFGIRFLRNLREKGVLRPMRPTDRRRKESSAKLQGVSSEFEDMRKGAKFMKVGADSGKQHGLVPEKGGKSSGQLVLPFF